MLSRLIIINVAVFILVRIIMVFFWFFKQDSSVVTLLFSIPADTSALIYKPWTLLTYMFYHEDFFHILFNMLWLFWFGRIFTQFLNDRQLLTVYLLGGLTGAVFFIASFNIFPVFSEAVSSSIALGASAAVMAVVFAISFIKPQFSLHLLFFGRIRIIYIALGSLVLDLIMINTDNSGGHLAHIGGAAFGYLYSYLFLRGNDMSRWFKNVHLKSLFRNKKADFSTIYSETREMKDEEYNYKKAAEQKEVDRILEKIAKGGYESLTKKEKETLFKASRK